MKPIHVLMAVLMAAVLAGCSASNMASRDKGEDGQYETVLKSNNSLLYSRLQIAQLNERQVGDLMQVQATLENAWKFELDFQYKFKWFDANGFELAPEGQAWRQLILPGRNQANVQAVAPNPTAARYEIWVRE
ncbi:MAG: YcfL family protein [Alcanivoracaceae bacterium]|jgi:uncharacterized protein YcfL|nr:YcfL family protein [Alcanivoracaceae bacterium]